MQRVQDTYSVDGSKAKKPKISHLIADVMVPSEEKSPLSPLKGKFQSVGANFLMDRIFVQN